MIKYTYVSKMQYYKFFKMETYKWGIWFRFGWKYLSVWWV